MIACCSRKPLADDPLLLHNFLPNYELQWDEMWTFLYQCLQPITLRAHVRNYTSIYKMKTQTMTVSELVIAKYLDPADECLIVLTFRSSR